MKDEVMEVEEIDADEDAAEVESIEDDLEYDEDGNVLLPDDDEEGDEEGEAADVEEEDEEDADEDDGDEEEPAAAEDDSDDEEDAADDQPAPESDEVKDLRARLATLEKQAADTLKKLGAKEQADVMKGLAELAAEADGLTADEYQQKRAEEERKQQAENLLKMMEFEKVAAADLAELKSHYPELSKLSHVRDLPDDVRGKFAKYRELGLPAKEAYAAANPDGIRTNVAEAVKKQTKPTGGKEHLRSSVPKRSTGDAVNMSRAELAEWREMFPHKSDREIMKLYKQTAEKE